MNILIGGVGIPLCLGIAGAGGAIVGGIAGEAIPDIFQSFQEGKAEKVGYCIDNNSWDEATKENFFTKTQFKIGNFAVTGMWLIIGILIILLILVGLK